MSKPDPELEEILALRPTQAVMTRPLHMLGALALNCLLWFGVAGVVYAVFR